MKKLFVLLFSSVLMLTGCGAKNPFNNAEFSNGNEISENSEGLVGNENVGFINVDGLLKLTREQDSTDTLGIKLSKSDASELNYKSSFYVETSDDDTILAGSIELASNPIDLFGSEKESFMKIFDAEDISEPETLTKDIKKCKYKYIDSEQVLDDHLYYSIDNKNGTTTFISIEQINMLEDYNLNNIDAAELEKEADNLVKNYKFSNNGPKWTNVGLVNGKITVNASKYDTNGNTIVFTDNKFNYKVLKSKYFNDDGDKTLTTYAYGGLLANTDPCNIVRTLTVDGKQGTLELDSQVTNPYTSDSIAFTVETDYGTATAYETFDEPRISLGDYEIFIFADQGEYTEDEYKKILKSLVFE